MVSILVFSPWLNIHFVWLFSGWWYPFYYWLVYSSCIFKANHTFMDGSSHWTSAPENCSPGCATGATLTNSLLLTNFPDSPPSLFPCYILLCSWDASVFCSIGLSLDPRLKKFYFLCERALVQGQVWLMTGFLKTEMCFSPASTTLCLASVAWYNYGMPISLKNIIFTQASWVFCLLETVSCLWNILPLWTSSSYIQCNCY